MIGLSLALVGSSLVCLPMSNDAFGMVKVAVALLGAALMWANGKANRTEMDGPIAACAIAFLASASMSVSPWMSFAGFQGQPFYGGLAMAGAGILFYAANASEWKEGPALCCAVVAIDTGFACMFERFGCPPPFQLITGRAVGMMGSPAFMGTLVAVTVPVCVWLSEDERHYQIGTLGVFAGLWAMYASGSRGPWLASGVGFLAYLLAGSGVWPSLRAYAWASLAFLCLLTLWACRLHPSDLGRYWVWFVALKGGMSHPFLGWGPDTFFVLNYTMGPDSSGTMQASAHNDLLQAWATMGIVGLAAYCWAWWKALGIAWKFPPVFGSLVALFIAAKFNPVPPSALYLCAALLGSVAVAEKPSRAIWAIGAAVLLMAPGAAIRLTVADGSGNVYARTR